MQVYFLPYSQRYEITGTFATLLIFSLFTFIYMITQLITWANSFDKVKAMETATVIIAVIGLAAATISEASKLLKQESK